MCLLVPVRRSLMKYELLSSRSSTNQTTSEPVRTISTACVYVSTFVVVLLHVDVLTSFSLHDACHVRVPCMGPSWRTPVGTEEVGTIDVDVQFFPLSLSFPFFCLCMTKIVPICRHKGLEKRKEIFFFLFGLIFLVF